MTSDQAKPLVKLKIKSPHPLGMPLFLNPSYLDGSLDEKTAQRKRILRTREMQDAYRREPEKFMAWQKRIDRFYKRAIWGAPPEKEYSKTNSIFSKSKEGNDGNNAVPLPSKTLWHYYYYGGKTRAERRAENLKRLEKLKQERSERRNERHREHKKRISIFAQNALKRREQLKETKKNVKSTTLLQNCEDSKPSYSYEEEMNAKEEAAIIIQNRARIRLGRKKNEKEMSKKADANTQTFSVKTADENETNIKISETEMPVLRRPISSERKESANEANVSKESVINSKAWKNSEDAPLKSNKKIESSSEKTLISPASEKIPISLGILENGLPEEKLNLDNDKKAIDIRQTIIEETNVNEECPSSEVNMVDCKDDFNAVTEKDMESESDKETKLMLSMCYTGQIETNEEGGNFRNNSEEKRTLHTKTKDEESKKTGELRKEPKFVLETTIPKDISPPSKSKPDNRTFPNAPAKAKTPDTPNSKMLPPPPRPKVQGKSTTPPPPKPRN